QSKCAKPAIGLLADGRELVAVLARRSHPLLWQLLALPAPQLEAVDSLSSMVRTFETYATQHLGLEEVATITLHGKGFAPEQAEKLKAELGPRFSSSEGPGPSPHATSQGLAMGGLNWDQPALDMATSLPP